MQTTKLKKKGFTLVELVIVVAVIAVLSAILIPSIGCIVEQAKETNDAATVRLLNAALVEDQAENGQPELFRDALAAMERKGYNIEKLTPRSSGDILWDSVNNRFALYKDGNPVYSDNTASTPNNVDFWKIVETEGKTLDAVKTELTKDGYSHYLKGDSISGDIGTITTGLDVGNNTGITAIMYKNEAEAQSVVIRTQGQMTTLTVAGKSGDDGDTVDHYGFANEVNVESVGNKECYHEYGTTNVLTATSGKIVIESVANIFELKKASSGTATFENKGGNVLSAAAGTLSESDQVSSIYSINSYEQLCSFRDATNSGKSFSGITVNLNCDITLTEAWTPISNYYRGKVENGTKLSDADTQTCTYYAFAGTFNGNNHTITGLTNKGISLSSINTGRTGSTPADLSEVTYGFFASINNAKIKNLTFKDVNIVDFDALKGDRVAACVGYANGSVEIENISVYGKIIGYDVVGGIVGGSRGVNIIIKNCENHADITATRQIAGIIGQIGEYSGSSETVIENCTNYGALTNDREDKHEAQTGSWYAISGIANTNGKINGKIVNCENKGNIATKTGNDDQKFQIANNKEITITSANE